MMKRPTEKDTKKVIMDYLAEVEKELQTAKKGKFNPAEVRKEEYKKEVAVKAEAIVEKGILNQDIIDEYEGLKEDIENKKKDLKALYGIDVKAETLAALIEANNIELTTFKEAKDALIAEKNAELEVLRVQFNDLRFELSKEYNDKKAELELQFKRDKENAKYDLDREKKIENDKWADEKATREAALATRESDVKIREEVVSEEEEEIADLKAEVEGLPQKIIIATKKAQEDAEKKMNSILEEREATLKKEVELDKKLLEQELAAVKAQLASEKENSLTLTTKLDAAYKQINEIATKVAQSNQPIYANGNNK